MKIIILFVLQGLPKFLKLPSNRQRRRIIISADYRTCWHFSSFYDFVSIKIWLLQTLLRGAAASVLIGQLQTFKQEQVINSKSVLFGWNSFSSLPFTTPGAYTLLTWYVWAQKGIEWFIKKRARFLSSLWDRSISAVCSLRINMKCRSKTNLNRPLGCEKHLWTFFPYQMA